MNWFTGLMVYVIIWWVVLFVTLPFGVKPQENPEPGTAPSAPAKTFLGIKLAVTTVASALLWALYWYVVSTGLISFRDAAM